MRRGPFEHERCELSIVRKLKLKIRQLFHNAFFDRYVRNIGSAGPIGDVEDIYRYATRANMSVLYCIQSKEELLPVLRKIKAQSPKVVLEIGTAGGATLFMLTRVADPTATVISLDLPDGPFGGGYSEQRVPLYQAFAQPEQTMHLMREDSHQPATLDKLKDLLQGRQIDFALIDGDHTYEGVKQDYEMYADLVRPGGLIAFHDIVYAEGVARFWDEIKQADPTAEEFIATQGSVFGLGVITKAS